MRIHLLIAMITGCVITLDARAQTNQYLIQAPPSPSSAATPSDDAPASGQPDSGAAGAGGDTFREIESVDQQHEAVTPGLEDLDDATTETEEEKEPSASHHILPPITFGPNGENTLQISGETRIRGEYRDNFNLRDDRNRDDGLAFTRTFVNFDLLHRDCVRAFVQILDAREIDTHIYQGQESHVDLHQAFLEFPLTGKDGPWSLRAGRQEMILGKYKTFNDASSWSNLRRRFDGLRAMYRTDELDADIFVLHPNYYERRRGDGEYTSRGRPRTEEYYYGAYITDRRFAEHTWEYYFLGLSDNKDRRTFNPNRRGEDGAYGEENRFTVGSAFYGPLHEDDCGILSYYVEGAYQFGRYASDRIRAYIFRGSLTHEWKRPWKPTVGLVGTLSSGDRDPDDGTAGRLDYLWGSTSSPYGIMNVVNPRNLREIALVGSVEPNEKLTVRAEAHAFWLDSKTDSWDNLPGQSSLRDRSGRSGREIGQEISLEAEYDWSECLSIEAGAAHFFPGSFPASHGKNDGANFFYLQTTYRF